MSLSYSSLKSSIFNILGIPPIFQFLSDQVDENQENGYVNVIDNYSVTPKYYKITSKPGWWYALTSMKVTIRDDGKFNSGFYGNDLSLTNGVKMVLGSVTTPEWSPNESVSIITNPDWCIFCTNYYLSNYGIGIEQLTATWDFTEIGRPIILNGDDSEYLGIKVNDDFSDLEAHYFQIQGLKIKKSN